MNEKLMFDMDKGRTDPETWILLEETYANRRDKVKQMESRRMMKLLQMVPRLDNVLYVSVIWLFMHLMIIHRVWIRILKPLN